MAIRTRPGREVCIVEEHLRTEVSRFLAAGPSNGRLASRLDLALAIRARQERVSYRVARRVVDTALAVVGLAAAAMLAPLVLIANALFARGPLLYSQDRLGSMGRTFRIHKFRTMVTDAEARGPQWCAAADQRITLVGRILRKTRIDELPQCWNILKGEMSVVGPRPERPEMSAQIEQECPEFRLRLLGKPGLTGLAQVSNGYASSLDDSKRKLECDLEYLQTASVTKDLALIATTVPKLLWIDRRNRKHDDLRNRGRGNRSSRDARAN